MNYIKIVIAVVIALNIFNCGGSGGAIPENGEYQGNFAWQGTIKGVGYSNYWTIACYSDCDTCYAYQSSSSDPVMLNKKKHGEIFTYCLTLPAKPIEDDPEDDSVVVPLGEVVFQGDDSLFGTDLWRTCRAGFVEEINYRSIEVGNHAKIKIELTEGILKAYQKVYAVLDEPGTQNYASFAPTYNKDTLRLYNTSNSPNIYTDSAAPNGALIEVKVLGISDTKQPACLAGDCEGSGDRMQIVLYQQKILTDNHLYYVNNPPNKPANTLWKKSFNKVLQQAVVSIDTVYTHTITDTIWDLNGNGFVDIPVSLGMFESRAFPMSTDTIYNELGFIMLDSDKCSEDLNSSTFILNNPIYAHYILAADADSGDTVLHFETVQGLSAWQISLKLGRFYGLDTLENLIVTSVNGASNSVTIKKYGPGKKGIERKYRVKDAITARTGELIKGITPSLLDGTPCASCSFIKGDTSDNMGTYIHEFLHQKKNGNLKHVGEEADSLKHIDNIMHPSGNRTNNLLRYRLLSPYHFTDKTQYQWDQLHK